MPASDIVIRGAREHNLRSVDVVLPRNKLICLTGVSGSGKSSLAFDTIYAEGQRRYVEALSTDARQYLEQLPKPNVERIDGLTPTLAVEQRLVAGGPRSTVATATEIHDFLRVLYARAGDVHCWRCGRPMRRWTVAQIVEELRAKPLGTRMVVLAPLARGARKDAFAALTEALKRGFVRARLDGRVELIESLAPFADDTAPRVDVVVDRVVLKEDIHARLAESVETAATLSGGRVVVMFPREEGSSDEFFSTVHACPDHDEVALDDLSPGLFSFNSPKGACATCTGLGRISEFDPELVVPDEDVSLTGGAIAAWPIRSSRPDGSKQGSHRGSNPRSREIADCCQALGISPEVPFRNLPEHARRALLYGTGAALRLPTSRSGTQPADLVSESPRSQPRRGRPRDAGAQAKSHAAIPDGFTFEGILPELERRWQAGGRAVRHRLHRFRRSRTCPDCRGARLGPRPLAVRLNGKNLAEMCGQTLGEALAFFEALAVAPERRPVVEPLAREIRQRLEYLVEVGVAYLTLDRASESLSGGEAQRIRLATHIGSGLVGVCYVLDEPTVGLHARDTRKLLAILRRLTQAHNTVIVVEHDDAVILAADHVIDIGPGPADRGGRVVADGTVGDVVRSAESLTGRYLSGELRIPTPRQRRLPDPERFLELRGVREHNLKNISVRIPLDCFTCVTGVSGSGKSTLVNHVFLPELHRRLAGRGPARRRFDELIGAELVDKVLRIDQSPLGRSSRSNPATYVGAFDLFRELFARTREARVRGYAANRFSFNTAGGRCEVCAGQGTKRIHMHFLPDVFVECEACRGARYSGETLEVRFRGLNIAEVLNLRVDEALGVFDNFSKIRRLLGTLKSVGLGYVALGQSCDTLSGGEAQRLKLAAQLCRPEEAHTLYVLDEPTRGLHAADVHTLLGVFHQLLARKHTVVAIEHHLDVIKSADWVIDLGPEGGEAGGRVLCQGAPEEVCRCPGSYTGEALRARL